MARSMGLVVSVLLAAPAFAENAERGQSEAEEQVLPKLNLLCGTTFTVKYDLASLKANNKDIGYDQTSGSLVCDEPLRLLWALCKTDAGKAVVRKQELREVQCRGVKGSVGKLSVANGVIVVDRANEEPEAWVRARAQFEKALKVKVPMKVADPYEDDAWRDFRQAPAPVTSTTDYCLINGEKVKYDPWAGDQRRDGTVKCLKNGAVVIELTVKDHRRTGLNRVEGDGWYRIEHFVDGKPDGVTEQFKGGTLVHQQLLRAGERVWWKEFYDSGALKDYTRQLSNGQLSLRLREDGRVSALRCAAEARGDEVMESWCGFGAEKTVQLVDGTDKVSATLTHRDGVLLRQEAGDSHYASRASVSFVEGNKKDGEERITREDGTLAHTVMWKAGVQDGPEQVYSKDGKKIVERTDWKAGEKTEHVEYFLNGNAKLRERFGAAQTLERSTWFDLGQTQTEGHFVRCGTGWNGRWCEDGTQKRWFENGKLSEEAQWKAGKRDGSSKRWFASGSRESEETWVNDTLVKRRQWDEKGAVTADDEFEEDGSRKVKRR